MKRFTRRMFLGSAAASLLPALARAAGSADTAYVPLDYTPGLLQQRLDRGDTILIDFWASWCSTCAAQDRVLNKLLSENPAYGRNISFIRVDWDTYGESIFVKRMRIPRRSTLVLLKGKDELGRLVADTRPKSIRALLDTALTAAQQS